MNSIGYPHAAAGAALALLLAIGAVPAAAQTFEGEGVTGLLKGLGLTEDEEQGNLDMRERAPLVVPPTRQLPPPVPKGSAAAARADFPVDADRQSDKAQRAIKEFDDQALSGRRLTHAEMQGDTLAPGTQATPVPRARGNGDNTRTFLSRDQLRNGHAPVSEEASWAKGEPARVRLSDPPAGYRAPAATAPYQGKDGEKEQSGGFWSRINPF